MEFLGDRKTYRDLSWRDQYHNFRDEVVINFSVQEVFNGAHRQEIAVRVTKSLGSCGFEYRPGELYFVKGKQYLVYARWRDGRLRTDHCSPTRMANDALSDITELRRLRDLPSSRIIGTYSIRKDYESKSAAFGQTVTFNDGDKRITVPIQSDGRFSLSSISPGTYRVTASVPSAFQIGWNEFGRVVRLPDRIPINPKTVKVEEDSCTEIDLQALPDGRISGIVVDHWGKPVKGAGVRIWNADSIVDLDHWWGWDETGDNGKYEKAQLPPGRYVIGVYFWTPEQSQRYVASGGGKPTLWFYPGVLDSTRAIAIPLKFGQHRSDIGIRVSTGN